MELRKARASLPQHAIALIFPHADGNAAWE